MSITIENTGSEVIVKAEYNSIFVQKAKAYRGKWQAPHWVFDVRDEQRIRDLCKDVYGSDGVTSETVTLRIEWRRATYVNCGAFFVHGRKIAGVREGIPPARLGHGIILLEGGFDSGGSRKNWETTVEAGTVVLVRDFPAGRAKELIEEQTEEDTRFYSIEDEATTITRDDLIAERDKLMARLEEVNALLEVTA